LKFYQVSESFNISFEFEIEVDSLLHLWTLFSPKPKRTHDEDYFDFPTRRFPSALAHSLLCDRGFDVNTEALLKKKGKTVARSKSRQLSRILHFYLLPFKFLFFGSKTSQYNLECLGVRLHSLIVRHYSSCHECACVVV
jgi:hypothetical protein